jgi:hypothetical protein
LISNATSKSKYHIPVIIVGFNNGRYLDNMVAQLLHRETLPIIIDNASTDSDTIEVLREVEKMGVGVTRSSRNLGHLVGFMDPIYKLLPEVFAYTDPDLQFHPDLPENYLLELFELTNQYECYKAGMALDISSFGTPKKWKSSTTRKYPFLFKKEHDILDWEHQFWTMPLKHDRLEVYAAPIDTTFAVYQKKYFHCGDLTRAVRVGGYFSACHLPWYSHLELLSEVEQKRYLKEKKLGFR